MANQDTQIKLFNTESRQKEIFTPMTKGQVKMYTCGPTVYDYAHIGNYRAFIFEDLLRRSLSYFGLKVTQVMNLTDVDDKTIRGALAQKISLDAYTKKYKDAFFEDLKTLGVQPAEIYPSATEYIEEMIQMIQTLLNKGIAYFGGDGSVYYSIDKFPEYGKLSHLNIDDLQAGASKRVSADEYEKEHVCDFVLWKKYDPERDGGIYWESPFGKGRPGWHLECSAMAVKLLGETIDIHVGGIDNMFPHHENEIAQSEACTGKCFSHLWMHSEHLIVDGKKMSKSLGNFYTLRDLLNKGYTGLQIRYLLFQAHYRTQLNFTFAGLDAAQASLNRLHDFIRRLNEVIQLHPGGSIQPELTQTIQTAQSAFSEALADDLNISPALAAVFELVHSVNALCETKQLSGAGAEKVIEFLKKIDAVLGVLFVEAKGHAIPEELQQLLAQRQQARAEKNWKLSDQIRDKILDSGYLIEDTPTGAFLKPRQAVQPSVHSEK
jgi:cysteinyl-tRNA synthetase